MSMSSSNRLFRKDRQLENKNKNKAKETNNSVKLGNMRTLKFRPSFPSCVHRKVSDERPKRSLEMGDFPLHILENRRRERLAELKAECLELKHQLSGKICTLLAKDLSRKKSPVEDKNWFWFLCVENSLQLALLKEVQDEDSICSSNDKGPRVLSGQHSKSMHELRQNPQPINGTSTLTLFSEEALRRKREERLQVIRRELEQFAIRYSIGEYAENIDGIEKSPVKNSPTKNLDELQEPPPTPDGVKGQTLLPGQLQGLDAVNAAILLRIQRQREQELQRARLELKHLAFRLKHKLDEEGESAP